MRNLAMFGTASTPSWLKAVLFSICSAVVAPALPSAHAQERIHFNDLDGIQEWRRGDNAMLFVQDRQGQWYKAELVAACMKYDTSQGIRFLTELDEFDNEVSKVMVERRICEVSSLTKVAEPTSAGN